MKNLVNKLLGTGNTIRRKVLFPLAVAGGIALSLYSCGGGGGSEGSNPQPPKPEPAPIIYGLSDKSGEALLDVDGDSTLEEVIVKDEQNVPLPGIGVHGWSVNPDLKWFYAVDPKGEYAGMPVLVGPTSLASSLTRSLDRAADDFVELSMTPVANLPWLVNLNLASEVERELEVINELKANGVEPYNMSAEEIENINKLTAGTIFSLDGRSAINYTF